MLRVAVAILCVFNTPVYAEEQDSMDKLVNKLLVKVVNKLFDRELQMPSHHDTGLQNTTLGKPGQLAVPTSRVSAQSASRIAPPSPFAGRQNVKGPRQCKHFRQQLRSTKAAAAAAGAPMSRASSRSPVAARAATLEKVDEGTPATSVREDMRNIAIVAHVDHGKTTLVDAMIQSVGALGDRKEIGSDERVMDSNDQEKERGITILAKNAAIDYEGTKINIVDTPGHADFGGEVERVLNMVDSVLLLVDAKEGPKPQTRFVLKKAIAMGLKILVVVNKIDRPASRPDYVIDKTFDLFCELGASDEQVDFPIVYASAINRVAGDEPEIDDMKDMKPLFDKILELPKPPCDPTGPLQLQISSVASDNFIGRLGIGRIKSGSVKKNSVVGLSAGPGEDVKQAKVGELFAFDAMGKIPIDEAKAGEIVVFSGIQDFDIGNTVVALDDPRPLPPLSVETPTMEITFGVNKSPFAGQVGKLLTSRQIRDRLMKECETNVALKVEDDPSAADTYIVRGRGLLHLTVLIETMRREGFEMMVGPPRVIEKTIDGERMEPFELVDIEVPEEFSGSVINLLNTRKGSMLDMGQPSPEGVQSLQYEVPVRGMSGVKSQLLTASKGLIVMTTTQAGYKPYAGDFGMRNQGNLLSNCQGSATGDALMNAQQRGEMFAKPGDEVYENQIVGICARGNDLAMNICKAKKLTNMRAAGSDENVKLTPPKEMTLEESVEYIIDNEFVEVTPDAIRMGVHPKKAKPR